MVHIQSGPDRRESVPASASGCAATAEAAAGWAMGTAGSGFSPVGGCPDGASSSSSFNPRPCSVGMAGMDGLLAMADPDSREGAAGERVLIMEGDCLRIRAERSTVYPPDGALAKDNPSASPVNSFGGPQVGGEAKRGGALSEQPRQARPMPGRQLRRPARRRAGDQGRRPLSPDRVPPENDGTVRTASAPGHLGDGRPFAQQRHRSSPSPSSWGLPCGRIPPSYWTARRYAYYLRIAQ